MLLLLKFQYCKPEENLIHIIIRHFPTHITKGYSQRDIILLQITMTIHESKMSQTITMMHFLFKCHNINLVYINSYQITLDNLIQPDIF